MIPVGDYDTHMAFRAAAVLLLLKSFDYSPSRDTTSVVVANGEREGGRGKSNWGEMKREEERLCTS